MHAAVESSEMKNLYDGVAVAHPLAREAEKTADERGRYLYPVEQGVPAALSVDRTKGAAIP